MKERSAVPRKGHFLWGRPVLENCTPVNMENRLHSDNGEVVVGYPNHRLTHCVSFTPERAMLPEGF